LLTYCVLRQLDRWTVRVPLGSLPPTADYPLVHLTSSTSAKPCPKQFLRTPSRTPSAVIPVADHTLTLSPTTPLSLEALAKRHAPLVSVHISTFADFQVIGFAVSHSVTDGKGFGMWARAFSAELNGEEWEAPPVETLSRLDEAVQRLQKAQGDGLVGEVERVVAPGGLLEGAGASGVGAVAKMLGAIAVERLWYGLEDKGAFIGHDLVDWLVTKVKHDVEQETNGSEFVSTYDVLIAWLLKAAYADEPRHSPLKPVGVMDIRPTLSSTSDGISLESPPLALMASWMYAFPHTPDPHTATLAQLALHHRRALLRTRTPAQVSASYAWLESFRAAGQPCPLFVSTGFDSWGFTNQADCGIADAIDWGRGKGQAQLYGCSQAPEYKEHVMKLTRQETGWVWQGAMRKSRWASAERELAKLEGEWRAETEADGR